MGKKVHIDRVREFIAGTPTFTPRDVAAIVGDRGYALLMLHNLAARGEIHRVTRGVYSRLDDPVLAVFAFAPAYLGLQEALSMREEWEQETNVVLVTSGKAAPGEREVLGARVIVHRVSPKYFFGFDHVPYGGFDVPVSGLEKTLIDLVFFGESPGGEAFAGLLEKADGTVLDRYLARYPRRFVTRFWRQARPESGNPRPSRRPVRGGHD